MSFDIEKFVDQLETALKANLASQITSINAEKNDSIVLPQIHDKAWYFQSFDDSNHNYGNFIFYHLADLQTIVNGPMSAQDITFEILMFLVDPNDDTNLQRKILRYWRCVQGAAAATWGNIGVGYDNATIRNLMPISLKSVNSSVNYKVFGVSLNFTLS